MLLNRKGRGSSWTGEGRFLVRGISATAVVSGCSAGLALVTTAYLGHELGASGYGAYAWALAWVYTLRIPALAGTDRLVTREIGAYRAGSTAATDPADAVAWADRSALRTSLAISLFVGLGAVGWRLSGDHLATYLAIAIPLLPVATLIAVRQAALLADRRVAWALGPESVLRPVLLLVLLFAFSLAAFAPLTATAALVAHLVAATVALVVATVGLRRAFGAFHWVARIAKPSGWYASGARIGASNTLIALSLQADLLLLGLLRGPRDAGIYAVITRGTTLVNLPALIALPALSPVVATLHAAGDIEALRRQLTRVTRYVFLASAVGCLVLAAFAGPLLGLITPGFQRGVTGLQVLLIGAAVGNFTGFNLAVLTLTGFERAALHAAAVSTVVSLALGVTLIPVLGVTGAAIAATARIAVRNVLGSIATWRELSIDSTVLGLRPARTRAPS